MSRTLAPAAHCPPHNATCPNGPEYRSFLANAASTAASVWAGKMGRRAATDLAGPMNPEPRNDQRRGRAAKGLDRPDMLQGVLPPGAPVAEGGSRTEIRTTAYILTLDSGHRDAPNQGLVSCMHVHPTGVSADMVGLIPPGCVETARQHPLDRRRKVQRGLAASWQSTTHTSTSSAPPHKHKARVQIHATSHDGDDQSWRVGRICTHMMKRTEDERQKQTERHAVQVHLCTHTGW